MSCACACHQEKSFTKDERQEKKLEWKLKHPRAPYWDVPSKLKSMDTVFLRQCYEASFRAHWEPGETVTQGWETVTIQEWQEAMYFELQARGVRV